jgi:hypothetical protein
MRSRGRKPSAFSASLSAIVQDCDAAAECDLADALQSGTSINEALDTSARRCGDRWAREFSSVAGM